LAVVVVVRGRVVVVVDATVAFGDVRIVDVPDAVT
jgi:hypothetical protein